MARAIDADKLMEQLQKKKAGPANKRYIEGFNDCLMKVRSMVHSAPTLTPPNEWVRVKDAMPPEHEPVLCIVSGSPKPNIILDEAYQLGSWNKDDGWIIDEYLEWTDADVLWWRMLPAPPDCRPPEGEDNGE